MLPQDVVLNRDQQQNEIEDRLMIVEILIRELLQYVAGPERVQQAYNQHAAIKEAIDEGAEPWWPHKTPGKSDI